MTAAIPTAAVRPRQLHPIGNHPVDIINRQMSAFRFFACAIFAFAGIAPAATITATYDVPHTFRFRPGGDVLEAKWRYSVFASARLPIDRDFKHDTVNAGPPNNDQKDAAAKANGADSEAHSSFQLDNFAANNVSGTVRSWGRASVDPNANSPEAFASSLSELTVRGGTAMKNGKVQWGPAFRARSQGQSRVTIHDPIHFEVFDLIDGSRLFGTLLEIELDGGEGDFDWTDGLFFADAREMNLSIIIDSPWAVQHGTLDFRVSGGLVTRSIGTGLFAGLFPGIGSPGAFSVVTPDLTLDYDLGSFSGHPLDISFGFGNGGEAAAEAPEPGSFALIGVALIFLASRRNRKAIV